jgi:uncharacterized membrane protein YfcA
MAEEETVSWLTDWDEAAKKPKRTLAFMFLTGLVVGGLVGYFGYYGNQRSPLWAAILGVTFATILTYVGWRSLRDPAWAQRRRSREAVTRSMVALAIPFGALAIAFIVGLATHSGHVFVVVFALGLALGLRLRFTILR